MAEPADSHLAALKTLVSRDRGEFAGSPLFGANLGTLIGSYELDKVLAKIPDLVKAGITQQGLVPPSSVLAEAFPIDVDQVEVFLTVSGEFVTSAGQVADVRTHRLSCFLPFGSGRLKAVVRPQAASL